MLTVDPRVPFRIDLDAGPGGGYLWELRALPDGVRVLATHFAPLPQVASGAGARQEFELLAMHSGRFRLDFALTRRWDPHPIENRSFDVEVR